MDSEQYALKKQLDEISQMRGNGTSLVTYMIVPTTNITDARKRI